MLRLWLVWALAQRLLERARRRRPDFVIGSPNDPYLLHWHLLPRNRLCNAYLHCFARSDDDRALHDHPWASVSVLLAGAYTEHTIAAGGIHKRAVYRTGSILVRSSSRFAHRIELHAGPCWTLFITGPKYRDWGFHCPERGWVHWRDFVNPSDSGQIGPGCGE